MPILIDRTYAETTPESAEDGENSDAGFLSENEPVGFRELVEMMKEHLYPSCSHPTGSAFEWYSTGCEVADYATGTERERCLHFSRDNRPHAARYWRLAAIAAGHVKR